MTSDPRIRAALVVLVLGAGLLIPGHAARADDALKTLRDSVLRALEEKDPARRAEALRPLETARDPLALDIVVEASRRVRGFQAKVRVEQLKTEQAYEKAINDLNELERKFLEANDESSRATDAFNKIERKFSEARTAALQRLRALENEFVRLQALYDTAPPTAGKILSNLEPQRLVGGLDLLEKSWLRSPELQDPVAFVDAVGVLTIEPARERLRQAVANAGLPPYVRAVALANLAAARDDSLPQAVLDYLNLGREAFALTRATIAALARVHRRESIEPLIVFLGRDDIGVLRDDARRSLRSLTGEKHGPFHGPWADWWHKAQADFKMPPDPVEVDWSEDMGTGVTFYGITTFSDRILFLLDVSLSMEKPDSPSKPQPDRMTVAKKELLGAISRVDDGKRLNVVLFNHEVIPWQPGMVIVDEDRRRRVKEWVEASRPLGGTNLHDSLETGFTMAVGTPGPPAADTIFFMTDGTPTAGKLQESAAILAAVRAWNRTAHLTIHCVAVGEADHEFLKALAKIGNGQYIRR